MTSGTRKPEPLRLLYREPAHKVSQGGEKIFIHAAQEAGRMARPITPWHALCLGPG